ncbi:MAG: hypothetical protein ABEJ23_03040 [Haloarculaceae archaeon]
MEARKLAPTVGIVGCLLVLALLAFPYLVVAPPSAVTTYYGSGAVTPFAAGLLAVVGVVVFAAGRQERSDPALTAGAALVFGGFVAVIAVLWALTVPRSVVTQLSTSTLVEYHRFVLAFCSLAIPASAAAYARALRLF